MQNVSTLMNRPVSIGTAAASGFLAFAAGALIAVSAPVVVAGLTASHGSNTTVSAPAAGGERISPNRSEGSLEHSQQSAQVAKPAPHDRSEEGMTSR
jgi:hypothetical protein